MKMAEMLNRYRFCVKEHVRGRRPKCFVIGARNITDAWKIARKRIEVTKLR